LARGGPPDRDRGERAPRPDGPVERGGAPSRPDSDPRLRRLRLRDGLPDLLLVRDGRPPAGRPRRPRGRRRGAQCHGTAGRRPLDLHGERLARFEALPRGPRRISGAELAATRSGRGASRAILRRACRGTGLGACPGIGMVRAPGACEAEARSEEDSDAGASSTTSDAAYARNPRAPGGFRRRGTVCFVAAPRRCSRNGLRRGASHPAPRRSHRGPAQYPDRLLGGTRATTTGRMAMPSEQKTRPIGVTTPLGEDVLLLKSMTGTE